MSERVQETLMDDDKKALKMRPFSAYLLNSHSKQIKN